MSGAPSKPEGEEIYRRWQGETEAQRVPVDQMGVFEKIAITMAAPVPVSQQRFGRPMQLGLAALSLALALLSVTFFGGAQSEILAGTRRVEPGETFRVGAETTLPLRFPEGTVLTLGGGAEARIVEAGDSSARLRLESGAVAAKVVKGDLTDYSIEAGPYRVHVTGTQFTVEWVEERFSLVVTEGSVELTGPDGFLRNVVAGGRCEVTRGAVDCAERARADGPAEEPSGLDREVAQPSEDALEPPDSAVPPATSTPASVTWQSLESQGKSEEAFRAAERRGLDQIYLSASALELMRFANVARLANRPSVANTVFRECRRRFPSTTHAARAAFLLGRASSGAAAVQWFTTYLQEAPGGPLAQEASGRLVELHHRLGQSALAKDAAQKYLRRYGDGPHAEFARSLAQP